MSDLAHLTADERDRPAILVDGLIVHRTPSMRSLLFSDPQALQSWVDRWDLAYHIIGPVLLLMVVGRMLFAEHFLYVAVGVLALGMSGISLLTTVAWWQTRGRVEKLSWARSVHMDMRPISTKISVQAGLGGIASLAASVAIGVHAPTGYWVVALFGVAFFTGMGLYLVSVGVSRMHYTRLRRRHLERDPHSNAQVSVARSRDDDGGHQGT